MNENNGRRERGMLQLTYGDQKASRKKQLHSKPAFDYSWIGYEKLSHEVLIFREIERATTDPKPRMKSACWGAFTCAGIQASFLVLES